MNFNLPVSYIVGCSVNFAKLTNLLRKAIRQIKVPPNFHHLRLLITSSPTVPKLQQLMPAVLDGDVPRVQSILDQLSISTASKGKGIAGKPVIHKKIKLSPEASPIASHDQQGSHDPTSLSSDTIGAHILLERCTNNNTVLHVCCSESAGGDIGGDDQPCFSGVDGMYLLTVR